MKQKIGLFSGGIETYWKDSGMEELPSLLDRDAKRLAEKLGEQFEVVYPGMAGDTEQSIARARAIREANVDAVVIYHATYVDDAMSLAVLDEIGPQIFPIHFHSQGVKGIPETEDLLESGTAWGNNSSVQICGTLKRMRPDLHFGYVFGALDNPAVYDEIGQYTRAWRCVKGLKGSQIRYLPHRCASVPMYDTFPDDTMMMAQTGVAIGFLTTLQLLDEIDAVTSAQTDELYRDITSRCDVIEPTEDEVRLACRLAIGLRLLVEKHHVDALAIEVGPEIMLRTGMLPSLGMALLIDQGVVVATEGDLSVSVGGLMLQSLAGKPVHFWEHLMFDEEKNWVLGGHEGGSAGFSMARKDTRPKLRSTQYVDFRHLPEMSLHGVLPEFITEPGPVTIVNLFRGVAGYEMRIATGRSVDTPHRPVHFEHTIFEPDVPLKQYFNRMKEVGVCHHFGLVHGDVSRELEKVARMLKMPCVRLTDGN